MPPEIYGVIIDEAHKHGLRVAAHVYHLQDARLLVADGVDVLAHSIRDADVDDALIAAMKKRGRPLSNYRNCAIRQLPNIDHRFRTAGR